MDLQIVTPVINMPAVPNLDAYILAGIEWAKSFVAVNAMLVILLTGALKFMAVKTDWAWDNKIITMFTQFWKYMLFLPAKAISKAPADSQKVEPTQKKAGEG